ncbi:MAG: glycosyltransferase family 4 protein [Rhizomicrobium sp.]
MPDPDGSGVIVVNGYKVFHLATLAEEYARKGRLNRLITGAYPYKRLMPLLAGLGALTPDAGRFAARRVQVCERRIVANWLGEGLCTAAIAVAPRSLAVYETLNGRAVDMMSRAAIAVLKEQPAAQNVYHVRSGFGGRSFATARALGYLTVCDHTIAHPFVIEGLIENGGALDAAPVARVPEADIWRRAAKDLASSDHVLVNSDFVKQTFARAGARTDNVHVVYLGIDDRFLDYLAAARTAGVPPRDRRLRMLFAGGVTQRKGMSTVAAALTGLDDVDWQLTISGNVTPRFRSSIGGLLDDPRVRYLGVTPRDGLAARMAEADVFVFPSLAEGSAKVVFEALAAGCFVITTPNSGSIVEDGVHGFLIPPGDPAALADAIRRAASDRPMVARIGVRNAALIPREYPQARYGERVLGLFDRLLAARAAAPR